MDINDHIDHQRWLIGHGLINDLHKDNLYLYGSLLHKNVKAVELHIDIEKKTINYEIFFDSSMMRTISRYKKLSRSTSIWNLWFLRRLLRKEGNLNFQSMLSFFVKTYLGPKWEVALQIKDFKEYDSSSYVHEGDGADQQPHPR